MYRILWLMLPQESEQAEIELKEDNQHAVEAVLRCIYGCKTEHYGHKPWQYWLDLFETADKYLEPELSSEAGYAFKWSALRLQEADVEEICEILQTLQDTDRYGALKDFAIDLTMRHLELLDNKQFRAQVYSCKRVMFKMVERLSFAVNLVPVKSPCECHGEREYYQKDENGIRSFMR